ncbi:MAG: MarR family transcriptional regulator [Bacteroidales bacterium]|nr:MarR family transcriptional regulator [Bacteroidales bacterium]
MTELDPLKLENQLCFPLYSAAKEVVRRYRTFLEPLGLTYTQYITMMVMWEHKSLSVGRIGELVNLDSGTLTPMLKKMEAAGLVKRCRSKADERELIVSITGKGEQLRAQALDIPAKMGSCTSLTMEEALQLRTLLAKLI